MESGERERERDTMELKEGEREEGGLFVRTLQVALCHREIKRWGRVAFVFRVISRVGQLSTYESCEISWICRGLSVRPVYPRVASRVSNNSPSRGREKERGGKVRS